MIETREVGNAADLTDSAQTSPHHSQTLHLLDSEKLYLKKDENVKYKTRKFNQLPIISQPSCYTTSWDPGKTLHSFQPR